MASVILTADPEEWEPTPDQCCECDQEAVGYDEGRPYCAAHYRSRPTFWEVRTDAGA